LPQELLITVTVTGAGIKSRCAKVRENEEMQHLRRFRSPPLHRGFGESFLSVASEELRHCVCGSSTPFRECSRACFNACFSRFHTL
jgi:hypothetical protein